MASDLSGKVAIVTGAAQGIGRAIARAAGGRRRAHRRRRHQRRRRRGRGRGAAGTTASPSPATSPTRPRWRRCTRPWRRGPAASTSWSTTPRSCPSSPGTRSTSAHWQQDHRGQPDRRVPDVPRLLRPDAPGRPPGPHRQHLLEHHLRRHAEHGGLCRGQGRRVRLHPGAGDRARQARHHRERGDAGADRVGRRHGQPARPGLRLRRDAAGHPRPGPARATSPRRSPSSPPTRRAGSPGRP